MLAYEIAEQRRAEILKLPKWTLIRVGWKFDDGHVQGGVYYRILDGLGPTGRDETARRVLWSVCQEVMFHADQKWGWEILASPPVVAS